MYRENPDRHKGVVINDIMNDEFSDNLSNLFDRPALDLIINLLAENFDKLKIKLKETCDYLEKSKVMAELHLTESELVRFRRTIPFDPERSIQQNNMSLDDFDL